MLLRIAVVPLAIMALTDRAAAQAVIPLGPVTQELVTTQFRTPLTYEAALAKLTAYYDEQLARKLEVAFPEIGPRQHYETWHDMWVYFGPETENVTVTMKRGSDNVTNRLVKNWMLTFAGRLGAQIPIEYKELLAPVTSETDIYATPKDLSSLMKSLSGTKSIRTWQHLALIVSASPMSSIAMESVGLHGVHHIKLTAENASSMKQLTAALNQGLARPCVCGVYSEMAELNVEIANEAIGTTSIIGAHSTGVVYTPDLTQKHQEDVVRTRPEMKRRIDEATGYYDVRFRPDKAYARVTITWTELIGYKRETGKFEGERAAGRSVVTNVRPPTAGAPPLNARIKLGEQKPGAYRIRLEGDVPGGQPARIDEGIFWFDGKVFEEL
jgi:hypothetical protein